MDDGIKKIGFVGLGNMGGQQARCLLAMNVPMAVFDVNPASMAPFAEHAILAEDVAGVGRDADAVGVCVLNDAQVASCGDQLISVMKPGSVLLIHSTVKPLTMIELGRRADERGVTVLDASVTRTAPGKEGPFVFCMTGGDDAAAAGIRPVIDAYATDTLHVGPLGSAMALKICNNLASWCGIMVGLEAFDLAAAAGVPLEQLLTVMKRNGVLTPPAQAFVAFRNNGGDEGLRAQIRAQAVTGHKDLELAEELAADAGAAVPIASEINRFVSEKIIALSERS